VPVCIVVGSRVGDEADELLRRRVVVTFGRRARVVADPGPASTGCSRARQAAAVGEGTVRLNHRLDGKAHVEVTAAALAGAHAAVFACAFPRFVASALPRGFDEGQR
jgi:hypothetical protein